MRFLGIERMGTAMPVLMLFLGFFHWGCPPSPLYLQTPLVWGSSSASCAGDPSWEVGSDSVSDRVSYPPPLYSVYSRDRGHLQLTCGSLLKCPPPTLLLFPKGTGLCESSLWILQAQAQHTASSHLGTLRAQVVDMCVRVTILPDDYSARSHSPLCTKATPHPVL